MCVVIDVVPLHYDVRVGADIIRPWFCCNNKTGRHRDLPLRGGGCCTLRQGKTRGVNSAGRGL